MSFSNDGASNPQKTETRLVRAAKPEGFCQSSGFPRFHRAAVKPFGMGFSWGGFESLVIPFDCDGCRTATKWAPGGPTLRLHIGLENVADLEADLEQGVAALKANA